MAATLRNQGLLIVGLAAAGLVLAAASVPRAAAQANSDRTAAIQAAYLRHIAEFTTWPANGFPAPDAPLVVGVIGDETSRVISAIRSGIERKGITAQSRALALRPIMFEDFAASEKLGAELAECHLIFVARSQRGNWPMLRALLNPKPVVTVSDIEGFSSAGGMIEFVLEPSGHVSMHIDLAAIDRAQLRLSSRLLGLKRGVVIVKQAVPLSSVRGGLRE